MFPPCAPTTLALLPPDTSPGENSIDSLPDDVLLIIVTEMPVTSRVRLMRLSKHWSRVIRKSSLKQKVIGFGLHSLTNISCPAHCRKIRPADVISDRAVTHLMSSKTLCSNFRALFPHLTVICSPGRSIRCNMLKELANTLTCLSAAAIRDMSSSGSGLMPALKCISLPDLPNARFRIADFPALNSLETETDMAHRITNLPDGLTHLNCRVSLFYQLSNVPFSTNLTHLFIKTAFCKLGPDQGIYGCRNRTDRVSFPNLISLIIAEDVSEVDDEWDEFFHHMPMPILNQMFGHLPKLQSLGLQVALLDDRCLTCLTQWLKRVPKLKAICLSGLFRGLVDGIDEIGKRGALDLVLSHQPDVQILFMDGMLLHAAAISKLTRLRNLQVYGTKLVTQKYVKHAKDEVIGFLKSEVAQRLTHICFRYDGRDLESEEILNNREVKWRVSQLKKIGKLENCRMGTSNIIESFNQFVTRADI